MKITVLFAFLLLCLFQSGKNLLKAEQPPNVILIMTDDQGYGDLGFTGNPHVKTPVIDDFARNSIRFNKFYVSPVCAPTRSSLLTGRISLRTGVRDTYNGGSIMATDEVTIAEMLKKAGYKTGIFGKWHLGDSYPSRAMDQGFDESVVHLAGGMGQIGDFTNFFKRDSSYYNPVLWHNGEQQEYSGYCTDIFTSEAIRFIEENQNNPFFCYIPFNAPHTPLQVPDEYYQQYKDIDPSAGFANPDYPVVEMSEKNKEDARKVYAMVTNIDDNLGRLFNRLDQLGITENTLVIFMSDNGPDQYRYVAGLRGRKGTVYGAGVQVPFYLRYPARFEGNRDIETTVAHIDILPTLAEICGAELPAFRKIDGKSMVPLIENKEVIWENRPLFFYWTRNYPELYNNIALQQGEDKLVGNTSYNAGIEDFELFNLAKDPGEKENLVKKNKQLATALKEKFDKTYAELITSKNILNPPLIVVGTEHENPVYLNLNDADRNRGSHSMNGFNGKWRVDIQEGVYDITFNFVEPVAANGKMYLEIGSVMYLLENHTETNVIEMKNVYLPAMQKDFAPFYSINRDNIFPFWVKMNRID